MSKLRWRHNDDGGITLQRWVPKKTTTYNGTTFEYTSPEHWRSDADVFKAKRGDRYVVRVLTDRLKDWHPVYDQYSAHSLREAMRMAKFLVGVKYGG